MAKLAPEKQHETAAIPPKPEPVADALVQHGLAASTFLLDLNRALTVPRDMQLPHPWNLPSRLFQFPIAVTGQASDGSRILSLRHPLLIDHPFVRRVQSALGATLAADCEPHEHCTWWHAVDLVSGGHWRDALETIRFTTKEQIAGAVAFSLTYSPHHEGKRRNGCISLREAREVMAAIDSPEPICGTALIREHFMPPSPVKSDKGAESLPINHWPRDKQATAWGHILGIEAGWFAHDRAGFLGWTSRGRAQFSSSGQSPASSLADRIGVLPTSKPTQLSLF